MMPMRQDFAIRKPGTNLWLEVDIDPSGMSLSWVNIEHATSFNTKTDAETMVKRLEERYPTEKVEIVPYE